MATPTAPAPAAAAGYDVETFGPTITIGGNWQKYNFFGTNPSEINAVQNADGSVTISGGGNTYGGQLTTATAESNGQIQGEAFGGGLYVEATISLSGPTYGLWGSGSSGWPAFWSNTIEGYTGSAPYIEPDFMEMDMSSPGQYGTAVHDWSNNVATGSVINVPAGTNLNQPNTYGFLWVPATATTQGYEKWYFNGQEVGPQSHGTKAPALTVAWTRATWS